jgi:hypothetical protein
MQYAASHVAMEPTPEYMLIDLSDHYCSYFYSRQLCITYLNKISGTTTVSYVHPNVLSDLMSNLQLRRPKMKKVRGKVSPKEVDDLKPYYLADRNIHLTLNYSEIMSIELCKERDVGVSYVVVDGVQDYRSKLLSMDNKEVVQYVLLRDSN